jgi:hypothetical protein
MQLSDSDKKLVMRLKQQQQQQIRWRWVELIAAIMYLGAGIYAFGVLNHFLVLQQPDISAILAVASLIPTVLVLFGIGVCLIVHLIFCWNGKPETTLLLKLIDESQEDA